MVWPAQMFGPHLSHLIRSVQAGMVALEWLAPGKMPLTGPETELSQRKSPNSFSMDIPMNSSCFHVYAKDAIGYPLEHLWNSLTPSLPWQKDSLLQSREVTIFSTL